MAGRRSPQELEEIQRRIKEVHGAPVRFLIWAGMGGSAEDKNMYNAIGLLKRGPRCYVLDSTDPAKLKNILADMSRRSKLPASQNSQEHTSCWHGDGDDILRAGSESSKAGAALPAHKVDSRPNFIYMTLPGSLLDQFARSQDYRRVELQPDHRNSAAGRHSAPLTRGSLYPLGLSGVDLKGVDRGDAARRRRD